MKKTVSILCSMLILCLMLAITGCALSSGLAGGMALSPMTLLFGLGSGFGYGLYSIFSRFALQKGYHPITITAYIFLFGALGGIPLTDFGQLIRVAGADGSNLAYLGAYTLVTTVTEGMIMDDIARNARMEMQRLRYDEDGCLMLVES